MADAVTNNSLSAELPDSGNGAILARLKELEAMNQTLQKTVEDSRLEVQRREDKIKELSIEKRKEMEEMIRTAIDSWLTSLPELSEEVRQQFRTGISRIAETADTKNAAWEVVCNASRLHTSNVNRIEELLNTCNQQSETIKTLVGGNNSAAADPAFASEGSRMQKRPRSEAMEPAIPAVMPVQPTHTASSSSADGTHADAWDAFGGLLMQHGRQTYGW